MSGGHFSYNQHIISDEARVIDDIIKNNNIKDEYEWSHDFSNETLDKFREASHTLKQASEMLQRIDWLISGDDGEESFHERWDKEVRNYFTK